MKIFYLQYRFSERLITIVLSVSDVKSPRVADSVWLVRWIGDPKVLAQNLDNAFWIDFFDDRLFVVFEPGR